jgi:hypothetical protein
VITVIAASRCSSTLTVMWPSSVAPSPRREGSELACSLSFSVRPYFWLSWWNWALSLAQLSKSETYVGSLLPRASISLTIDGNTWSVRYTRAPKKTT